MVAPEDEVIGWWKPHTHFPAFLHYPTDLVDPVWMPKCLDKKINKKCFQLPLCYLQLFAFLEGMGLLEATFKGYKGIQTGWKMMTNHIFAPTPPHSNLLLWVPLVPSVPWGPELMEGWGRQTALGCSLFRALVPCSSGSVLGCVKLLCSLPFSTSHISY